MADKLIYKDHWIAQFHIDASHQTQSNIIVKDESTSRATYVLKATESRVTNHMGLHIGDTYLLENGAESHALIFGDQLSKIVADNMRYIESKPDYFFIHAQNDTATHNNPENVRNIFLEGLKKELKCDDDEIEWINDNHVKFRFDELQFILSQESMHLFHRLFQLRAFKYSHPDSGYMQKDMKAIIRNIRLQYHHIKSPVILYTQTNEHDAYYTPYELIEKCKFLNKTDYDYVLSRFVRALWMLRGTKKKKYKHELNKFIFQTKYTQQLNVQEIRAELKFMIRHTPPYLLSAIFSV